MSPEKHLSPQTLAMLNEAVHIEQPRTNLEVIYGGFKSMGLRDVATAASDICHLDPELAKAYSVDYMPDVSTGLSAADNAAARQLTESRKFVFAEMVDDYAALTTGKYVDKNTPLIDPKDVYLNFSLAACKGDKKGDKRLDTFLKSDLGSKWETETQRIKDKGLLRSATIVTLFDIISFDFYHEINGPENRLASDTLLPGDIAQLYDGKQAASNLTLADITNRRRELGLVDLSKEKLDKRFAHLINAINTEYGYFGLQELRQMASMGGEREVRAKGLFERYAQELMGEDVSAKFLIMNEIESAYKSFAMRASALRNPKTAAAFRMMAERAAGHNRLLRYIMHVMEGIYIARGFDFSEPFAVSSESSEDQPELAQENLAQTEPVQLTAEYGPYDLHSSEDEVTPIETSDAQIATNGAAKAVAEELLRRLSVNHLDQVILPADMHELRGKLKEALDQTTRKFEHMSREVWEKVVDLATLCVENNGSMYRTRGGKINEDDLRGLDLTDGQKRELLDRRATPYFVVVFDLPDGSLGAMLESELADRATIGIDEGEAGTDWYSAVMRLRLGSEQQGVTRIIHATNAPFGDKHRAKMLNLLQSWRNKARRRR